MLITAALISGLGLGSMYGLLALGFHVTHAVSNTVNFAQGSTMMLGAVLCFTFWVTLGWPIPIAVALALVACAAWGVFVERVAVRPFVRRGSNSWLMATVALGIVLDNVVLFSFGKDPRGMPSGFLTANAVSVAGIRIQLLQIMIPVVGLALALGLHLFFRNSRSGKALLAVVQNADAARLMGVDTGRMISFAFALSGLLAGVAGILVAPLFTISSTMGTLFGIKVQALQLVIPVIGLLLAAAIHFFLQRTRYGKALLAVVQNRDAARLMGIDIERVVMASFALSGLLAGVAGILVAPLFTVSSTMGTLFGIKAFAVAILGGIGNAWGVVLAGLIYGIVEALITSLLGSTYTQIVTFALVIVALALRPSGLFGRAEVKKV